MLINNSKLKRKFTKPKNFIEVLLIKHLNVGNYSSSDTEVPDVFFRIQKIK